MTNATDYLWTANKTAFSAGWEIRSADDDRVVFCGLPKEICEVIAMTHNWEIKRIHGIIDLIE